MSDLPRIDIAELTDEEIAEHDAAHGVQLTPEQRRRVAEAEAALKRRGWRAQTLAEHERFREQMK